MTAKAHGARPPGIIIMTHGPLAEALITSASMLYGELTDVVPLTLEMGESPENYFRRLTEALETVSGEPLFLLDFVGGTPFNTLVQHARNRDVFAISGVNIPMLLEAAHQRESLSGSDLLGAVALAGHEGMVDLTEMIEEVKKGESE